MAQSVGFDSTIWIGNTPALVRACSLRTSLLINSRDKSQLVESLSDSTVSKSILEVYRLILLKIYMAYCECVVK
jgi:hypothetical protein